VTRILVLLVLCLTIAAGAAAQIPTSFTNLQVLPKDIPRAELVAMMRGFTSALAVRCTHCHEGPDNLQGMDFATDRKEAKQVARTMLKMVRAMNADYMGALPARDTPRQEIGCITCHQRAQKPPRPLPDILVATATSRGIPTALDQYRKFREEFLISGLYDFREATLNTVANRLREQKRPADALEILKLNAELFPKSPSVFVALGDTAVEAADPAAAEGHYRRALELDPGNAFAARALEELKKD
jgi:tetratricopeptide (TPR) repeat protein